jgi:hypothetical protein
VLEPEDVDRTVELSACEVQSDVTRSEKGGILQDCFRPAGFSQPWRFWSTSPNGNHLLLA